MSRKEYYRQYYLKHRAKKLEYFKQYWRKHNLKPASKHSNTKAYKNEWKKKRLTQNINFKIATNLRIRMVAVLKGKNKSQSALKLLGCTLDGLKIHLESKFKPGMTWKNYGRMGWHIDHIKPCTLFNLTKPKDQKQCFNYTNLQPLWAKDNLSKHNKY